MSKCVLKYEKLGRICFSGPRKLEDAQFMRMTDNPELRCYAEI